MSTIAQEITRIQGGVNDVWDYCEDNGVIIPTGTTVDEARTYLDQIPHGGSTPPFMEMTDLNHMFDYRRSVDNLIMSGIEAYKNNEITDLTYAFYYFRDNRYLTVPNESHRFLDDLKYYLSHYQNADKSYMLQNFNYGNWDSTYIQELDLSDVQILGTNIKNGISSVGSNGSNPGQFTISLGKDTLKDIKCQNVFERCAKNIKIKLPDHRLNFTDLCDNAFYQFQGEFLDENNNKLTELTISVTYPSGSSNTHINYFLSLDSTRTSSSDPIIERVHFVDLTNVKGCSSAFSNCFRLKSIDGMNFSSINGASEGNLFSTSGSKYYDDFGELSVVSGTSLGSAITNLNLTRIWHATADTIRDGQTVGYWFEKFANSLGNKTRTQSQTITINTTLYNSLTSTQKALITDKGYTLAHAA